MLWSTACGQPLDQALQPDPNLQPETAESPETSGASAPGNCGDIARSRLPNAFPDALCYPDAELLQVTESTLDEGTAIEALWSTEDATGEVRSFYREALAQDGWEITNPDASNGDSDNSTAAPIEAVKAGVRATVTTGGANAPFTVSYRPTQSAQARSAPEESEASARDSQQQAEENTASSQQGSGSTQPSTGVSFTDIDEAPEEFQAYIQDLAALGVLDGVDGSPRSFQPNEPVTRRTYARWLFNANNRFYTESSKRIRPTAGGDAVFQDVSSSNPDFGKIQGLADAGLVPSPLSGATAVTFRPDAPVTRETLIQWKAPLDLRQSLPNATLDAVQQAWGFQDAAKIAPEALQAILADYGNGDQSNIRRVFGFTTLFQPKKPVTRSEAAAAVWHFGYQGDGRSAREVLQGASAPEPAN
ncbi:MAG: S-layer homology domain-containing protein [Elainellaceae cyanobacterium]